MTDKTKSELQKELQELEELEKKVTEKKSRIEYKTLDLPFQVGKAYFFRTVTYFMTGRVKAIVGSFLVLEAAAWIADTGRFSQAINEGKLSEVEPIDNDVFVNTGSITDAFQWVHDLPRLQK